MKRLLFTIAWTVLALTIGAEHVPTAPSGPLVEGRLRTAVFYGVDELDLMLELQAMFEDEEFELRYRAATLGGYWRAHRNLKLGAFYRIQTGARHDDDWVADATHWWWEDSDRIENLLIVDASPRFLLEFLPARDWVFMLKNRYLYNTYNGHQTLKVRPDLTWFWIRDRNPVLNASLAYEAYVPLNFSDALIYEHWIYGNLLYHVSPTFMAELTLARRRVTWTDSEDYDRLHPGEDYSVDYRSWVVGLGAILRLR